MDEAVSLLYAALMVLTSLGSICGNLLLLLVLLLNKELQTDTWGLTLSFSLSDLALGLSTIPFGAHNSLFRPDGYPDDGALCQGSGFLFLLLQLASIHSLTWATIDKFTEICFALSYASICSLRRTRLVLVLVWFYSLLNAALPLLGFGRYSYSKTRFICAPSFEHANQGFNMLFIVAGIIAPTLIMCSLYGYIVYIARKQVRRGTFVCNDQHCFYVPANTYFRSSIVMVATSVCLLACWLPYICLGFYETISGREGPEAASALATWLVLFTATINPWINSMTQARYRAALKRSLLKLRQALQPQRKISRTQSTAFHLDAATSRSNTSSVVPPPKDESMTSQTGPGDTRGTSHTHTDRESPILPPSCYIVEVNEDRDTEGTEERDGTGNSTTQPHGPTGEFPQHVNRDRGSRHSQDCPTHTAEEHSTDPTQTGTVPEP